MLIKKLSQKLFLIILVCFSLLIYFGCEDLQDSYTYTITWKNENGDILEVDSDIKMNTMPTYDGKTPEKASTPEFSYTFNGWDKEVVLIEQDATYVATYTSSKNKYLITWLNDDGKTLKTDEVEYGILPVYKGEEPTKEATAEFTYTFKAWDKEVVKVVGNETYKATYTNSINKYQITWKNEDLETLETDEVAYGELPTFDGKTPTKASTAEFSYTFAGWDKEVVKVTGNENYITTFTSTKNKYTITWLNADGKVLEIDETTYGELPTYDGEGPTLQPTSTLKYEFLDWGKTIKAVTGDETYTAVYIELPIIKEPIDTYEYKSLILNLLVNLYQDNTFTFNSQELKDADEMILSINGSYDPLTNKVQIDYINYKYLSYNLNVFEVTYEKPTKEQLNNLLDYNQYNSMSFLSRYIGCDFDNITVDITKDVLLINVPEIMPDYYGGSESEPTELIIINQASKDKEGILKIGTNSKYNLYPDSFNGITLRKGTILDEEYSLSDVILYASYDLYYITKDGKINVKNSDVITTTVDTIDTSVCGIFDIEVFINGVKGIISIKIEESHYLELSSSYKYNIYQNTTIEEMLTSYYPHIYVYSLDEETEYLLVTSDMVSDFDTTKCGDTTFTITYKGLTLSVPIFVYNGEEPYEPASIWFSQACYNFSENEYNESLESELYVSYKYPNEGKVEKYTFKQLIDRVDGTSISMPYISNKTLGKQTIKVTIHGKTKEINCFVYDNTQTVLPAYDIYLEKSLYSLPVNTKLTDVVIGNISRYETTKSEDITFGNSHLKLENIPVENGMFTTPGVYYVTLTYTDLEPVYTYVYIYDDTNKNCPLVEMNVYTFTTYWYDNIDAGYQSGETKFDETTGLLDLDSYICVTFSDGTSGLVKLNSENIQIEKNKNFYYFGYGDVYLGVYNYQDYQITFIITH